MSKQSDEVTGNGTVPHRAIVNLMLIMALVAFFLAAVRNRGLETALLLDLTILLTILFHVGILRALGHRQ